MPPFSLCVGLAAWTQTELGWSHLSNVVRVCAPAAEPDGIGGMLAVYFPKAVTKLSESTLYGVYAKQMNSWDEE